MTVAEAREITRFAAFDLDGTLDNSVVSYTIVAVEPSTLYSPTSFQLSEVSSDQTVALFKAPGTNMDFEAKQRGQTTPQITVTVRATDNGKLPSALSTDKHILIQLKDANDNAPRFKQNYERNIVKDIEENQPTGTVNVIYRTINYHHHHDIFYRVRLLIQHLYFIPI